MNSQEKTNDQINNASDAFGPVAENLGRQITEFSLSAADTLADMEHHGMPKFEIWLNLTIGVLSGIRTELKNWR